MKVLQEILSSAALALTIATASLVPAETASAQTAYPTKNITLVLPFAAGSGTDSTTRIISKELGTAKREAVAAARSACHTRA